MNPGFIILVILGGVSFLLWALAFDAFVRRIHSEHHDLWLSLGKPPGWFWSPSETNWLKGSLARQCLIAETWLSKPDWVNADPALPKLWRRMFILAMICFAMPILLMIYAVTHPTQSA